VLVSHQRDDNYNHTVKYRVGNQPARVYYCIIADSRNRLAISVLQITERAVVTPQLLWVVALNVTTVILEKVGKLVV
jgi:hypothetical protein